MAPSVNVVGSNSPSQGTCCIEIYGAANTSFKLIWPGQSSPWCSGMTDSSGNAECCYSIGTGNYKVVCLWQINGELCESYLNPECD